MLQFGNTARGESATRWMSVANQASLLAMALLVMGCGGGGPSAGQTSSNGEAAPPKAVAKAKESADKSGGDSAATKSTSSGGGRKSSRGIPYDAFFDDPLGEVANTATVPTATTVAKTDSPTSEPTAKPAADAPKPAAGGGATAWNDLMPIDVLQEEVKKVRNHLTASMQSQKTYNDGFKEIAVDGAILAALGGVAREHSEAASWKANAHFVRDFGSQLATASAGLGKDNYEKSKSAYEKLSSIFGGSVPADAGDVPAERPFHEAADRGQLMKRIEKAKDWMRLNINTEAKLKSETEAVLHEAMIIATFGKVVATDGYSNADEEDYKKYAEALVVGAQEAAAAAKDQSFSKFTDALNKVNKSCADCHANYGNG